MNELTKAEKYQNAHNALDKAIIDVEKMRDKCMADYFNRLESGTNEELKNLGVDFQIEISTGEQN